MAIRERLRWRASEDGDAWPQAPRGGADVAISAGAYTVVGGAWIVVLVSTGSPAADVLRWVAVTVAGVVGPGFVLVRLTRQGVAPLFEDLVWAVPAGCLIALAGWFCDRVLPVSPGAFLFGPTLVAMVFVVPAGRRRVLAKPAAGWGWKAHLALASIVAFSLVWMAATGLQAYPLDPGAHGTAYFPDLLYQLSLVGELHHTIQPTYPAVAGTPLSYHWFLYAIISHLTTRTGVGRFDATLRLSLASMLPAMLFIAAVVGRRLSGRIRGGVLAAFMLGVLEASVPHKWGIELGSAAVVTRYWEMSPPQALGWITGLAAFGAVCAFLRRGDADQAVPVALTVPFLILCAGSKSSTLPVLGCGVGLALFVAVLRREWRMAIRCLLVVLAIAAVFEAATYTLYGGSSYGVRVQLGGYPLSRLFMEFPAQNHGRSALHLARPDARNLVAIASVALLVVPLIPRLLGLFYQLRLRAAEPGGWVAGGTATSGMLAPLLLRHPASSELYFLTSAYPIGVVGAASGLVVGLTDGSRRAGLSDGRRRQLGRLLVAAVASGAVAAFAVAHVQPRWDPVTRWIRTHPEDPRGVHISTGVLARQWATPWVEYGTVAAALSITFAFLLRRLVGCGGKAPPHRRLRILYSLPLTLVLLGAGVFGMSTQIWGSDQLTITQGQHQATQEAATIDSAFLVWRDTESAGGWVARHAAADDVIATNLYCRQPRAAPDGRNLVCDARNFIASAFTQRRSLIGGWAYADRVLNSAWSSPVGYTRTPFWDRQLYDEQYEAFTRPTRPILDDLYRRHHVRWLFLDLTDKRVAIRTLDEFAQRRFTGTHVAVWQLSVPAGNHVPSSDGG